MEVNGVLSRRQVVKVKFDPDARSLLPQRSAANALPLSIRELHLQLSLGLGCASGRRRSQR
jgi:hypothetical protein